MVNGLDHEFQKPFAREGEREPLAGISGGTERERDGGRKEELRFGLASALGCPKVAWTDCGGEEDGWRAAPRRLPNRDWECRG